MLWQSILLYGRVYCGRVYYGRVYYCMAEYTSKDLDVGQRVVVDAVGATCTVVCYGRVYYGREAVKTSTSGSA